MKTLVITTALATIASNTEIKQFNLVDYGGRIDDDGLDNPTSGIICEKDRCPSEACPTLALNPVPRQDDAFNTYDTNPYSGCIDWCELSLMYDCVCAPANCSTMSAGDLLDLWNHDGNCCLDVVEF